MKITKKTLLCTLLSAIVLPQNASIITTAEECYNLSQDIENMFYKIPFKSNRLQTDSIYEEPTFTYTFKITTNDKITEYPTTFYKPIFYTQQFRHPNLSDAITSTKKNLETILKQLNHISYTSVPFSYKKETENTTKTKYSHIFQDTSKKNTHTLFFIHGGCITGDVYFVDNIKDTTNAILTTLNNVDTTELKKQQPIEIESTSLNSFLSAIEIVGNNLNVLRNTDAPSFSESSPKMQAYFQKKFNDATSSLEIINPYKQKPIVTTNILEKLHQQFEQQIKIEKQCIEVGVRDHFETASTCPYYFTITLLPAILFLINHGTNVVLLEYDGDNGKANPLEQIIQQIDNTYKDFKTFTPEKSMLMGHSYGGFLMQQLIKHKANFLNERFAQTAIYAPFVNGYYENESYGLIEEPKIYNFYKRSYSPLDLIQTLNPNFKIDRDKTNAILKEDGKKLHDFVLENYFLFSLFSSQRINNKSNESFPSIIKQLKIPLFLFQGTADLITKPFSQLFDIIQSFKDAQYNNWQLFAFKHGTHHIHRAYSIKKAARFNEGPTKTLNEDEIVNIDSIRKQEFIRFLETLPLIIKKETATNIETINLDEKINDAIQNLTDPIEQISSIPGMNYQWFRKHILQEAN